MWIPSFLRQRFSGFISGAGRWIKLFQRGRRYMQRLMRFFGKLRSLQSKLKPLHSMMKAFI
ncbi:hypothetical protein SAMN06264849_10548 [Melghirimyces algeriensis]|uniref:Uncharacterized protein n=1 Tax=Melghirimyces algeriensis TaxID=910412 RepID=A0A521D3N1_9BACL|nr:hypothetical protein SAMN06264849_10548 [Melghirimyces algeriensis]